MKKESSRFSIITPCLNRAECIGQAIESVLQQDYPEFEHIVIDGGSKDGTLEILNSYHHLTIVTGKDSGMYDAINKGLKFASGDIIGFLNSDDTYYPGTFTAAADRMRASHADAVVGRAAYYIEMKKGDKKEYRKSNLLTDGIFWREITYGEPAFNAWFFRPKVFQTLGEFDTSYQIAGDRDFLLRFALSELSYVPLATIVYQYQAHNESLSMTQNLLKFSQIADENLRLADTYLHVLPPAARTNMQRIRTRDTITAASRNLRGGAYQSALHYMKAGFRYDKYWPLKFLFRILTGPFRVFGRMMGYHYFKV